MTAELPERYSLSSPAGDKLRQLLLLRAIAIAGQIITVAVVNSALEIPLPLLPLALGIGALALFNLATWFRLRLRRPVSDGELFGQILVDTAVFSVLLYFTGGAANPFATMYVLLLAIAAAMLPGVYAWAFAAVIGASYLLLTFFNTPLADANGEPVRIGLLATATLINFLYTGGLITFFLVKITASLREHEQMLVQARENELNNEHIVQLGAFAAGAAHELGTPLSTMAVVVKEIQRRWHKLPELLSELRVVSNQIEICKATLSKLLASAGRTRMDGGGKAALNEFLDAVVENCRSMRPQIVVTCRCEGMPPTPEIVMDQSLRQAITSLVNNAADASPERVDIDGHWNEQEFCIRICDRGQGIPAEVADKIGKDFVTTKPPGQGHGVGFMLSSTVIARFGGSVRLFNQPECGACTEVRLPLAPLRVSA